MLVLNDTRAIIRDFLQGSCFAFGGHRSLLWRWLCASLRNIASQLLCRLVIWYELLTFYLDKVPITQVPCVYHWEANLISGGVNGDPVEFELQIVASFVLQLKVEPDIACVHRWFHLLLFLHQ